MFVQYVFVLHFVMTVIVTGPRRSRNRGKGKMSASSSKPTTLQFESDFDFETANAQFNKEDIEKEIQEKLTVKGLFSLTWHRPCNKFLTQVAFEMTSIPNSLLSLWLFVNQFHCFYGQK